MSRYPPAHTSDRTTCRWDHVVMVTTTRALPLSSQSRLQHSPNTETHTTTTRICRGRGQPPICNMSFWMHEIDGNNGEDNPPRVKRTRRVFPRPIYEASSARALRCSGVANSCEYVRGRAIAVVDCFSRELCSKKNTSIRVSL